WDFEAPGLHRFFERRLEAAARERYEQASGVLDVLAAAAATLRESSAPGPEASDDEADAFVTALDPREALTETGVPNLLLMKAGRFDEDYAARVNTFDWEALFVRAPWLFTALARRFERDYVYTLIDSRTGLTDTSGICTMLLPAKLVVAFTPGRQSLT